MQREWLSWRFVLLIFLPNTHAFGTCTHIVRCIGFTPTGVPSPTPRTRPPPSSLKVFTGAGQAAAWEGQVGGGLDAVHPPRPVHRGQRRQRLLEGRQRRLAAHRPHRPLAEPRPLRQDQGTGWGAYGPGNEAPVLCSTVHRPGASNDGKADYGPPLPTARSSHGIPLLDNCGSLSRGRALLSVWTPSSTGGAQPPSVGRSNARNTLAGPGGKIKDGARGNRLPLSTPGVLSTPPPAHSTQPLPWEGRCDLP